MSSAQREVEEPAAGGRPGCAADKGPGLAAYGKVITDFNAGGPRAGLTRDLSETTTRFRAAARSNSPATAHALTGLASDRQAVLTGIRHRTGVPRQALARINRAAARTDRAAARTDRACGTLG